MALKPATPPIAVPLRGGAITSRDAASLMMGQFSMVQNLRPKRPGFIKRPGQIKKHSTADGTNRVETLYQFRKNHINETHLFAQMSDGDILEATDSPPTVTTGAFGTEVFSGSASQKPASWGVIDDLLIHSNGVDQHKVYAGVDNYVKKFVYYDGAVAPPTVPDNGFDYTDEVTDGLTTTQAVLDDMDDYADTDYDCLFICTPVPANRLTWTMGKPNGTAATGTLKYRKSDLTWTDTTETDGTISSSATLGQTGSMVWTPPSDEIPCYMFGVCGFWYQWTTDTQLDSEVEITKLTYGTDHDSVGTRTAFLDIVNTWDGLPTDPIEVQVYDNSVTSYSVYGAGASVDLGGISFDENDKIYVGSLDPLQGVYLDPGSTPNTDTTSAAALANVKYWDGDSWVAFSSETDETGGLQRPGWVTWERPSTTEYPMQFGGGQYYLYWYEITFDDAVSDDVVLQVSCWPYFDIDELGKGVANCPWQDRMCYSFDRWGQYIHVSRRDTPLALNGIDYGVLEAGDGRSNQVIAMTKFHNEMIAWQEEKGIEGGTTTLFEGYSPSTYGKLLLSSKVGIVNAKAHVVVDGVLTSTATEEKIKTLVFWISRYGVCASDGRTVAVVSDDVQNYFDPTKTTCIRRGYENYHWITFDSMFNCLRVGLVSGPTATAPNVFLVFDLQDMQWYFDSLGQELSCATEVESSGSYTISSTTYDPPILQIGGGTDDGFVYLLNYGQDDVSTAIDSYIDIELQSGAQWLLLRELILRCRAQSAGNITVKTYENKVLHNTLTLAMTAEITNDEVRRHVEHINDKSHLITVRIQHNTASQDCILYDLGVRMDIWGGR